MKECISIKIAYTSAKVGTCEKSTAQISEDKIPYDKIYSSLTTKAIKFTKSILRILLQRLKGYYGLDSII